MTYRVRNIGIAIALALVAAMLTTFYVTQYKRTVQSGEKNVAVYVAAKDVPAGTSGLELVKRHLLSQQDVSRRTVVPGAISSPDQVERLALSQPLYAGEQITLRRFATSAEGGIRAELKGTQRAVQLPGDANQLLVGTLRDGDRVDVVASVKLSSTADDHASRIVLRDIRVLRTSPEGLNGKLPTGTGQSYSILVAVTDTQVQKLFYVMKNADWSLELRPIVDAADSAEHVETAGSVLTAGTGRNR